MVGHPNAWRDAYVDEYSAYHSIHPLPRPDRSDTGFHPEPAAEPSGTAVGEAV